MNILIPMAGEGSRFSDVGYKVSKPLLPTYDRNSNKDLPMVVCAANNLYGANNNNKFSKECLNCLKELELSKIKLLNTRYEILKKRKKISK